MEPKFLFRSWCIQLIQGILAIILSFLIFNNPDGVLATLALWCGVVVMIIGMFGVGVYFAISKEDRDIFYLLGHLAIFVVGMLMVSRLPVTMKVITMIFGIQVVVLGGLLVRGSWIGKNQGSLWWLIALIGGVTMLMGIMSIFDIYSGAQNISTMIGISVFFSGIGLIFLAFLKKKVLQEIRRRM